MKNKKNILLNTSLVIIGIVFVTLVYFKLFKTHQPQMAQLRIDRFEELTLMDLSKDSLKLTEILNDNDTHYILILEMSNCSTCIYKGLDTMTALKKAGKACMVIVVHDLIDEVAGWSATTDFSPFYMMTGVDFYEHIRTPLMPAIVTIKNKSIINTRYITP